MKKKLFAIVLAAAMTFASAVSVFADAPEGSIAYFSFDDTIGDATPVQKLVPVEKDSWTFAEGKVGNALKINQEIDNIGLDTGVTIGTGDYTVSFWVKASTASFACPLIWIGRADQSQESWNGIWIGLNSGWDEGGAGAGSNDTINYSEHRTGITKPFNATGPQSFDWTYVTLTVATGETNFATLYYDGVEVGTQEDFSKLTEDAKLYVGANYWDNPCIFAIDELSVFDKVLTADEVAALYEASSPAVETPSEDAKDDANDADEQTTAAPSTDADTTESNTDSVLPIIIVVAAVVVVVVVVAVVVAKKKKK